MIIIIAIDRVLVITKGHTYKKHITLKVLYSLTVFALLLNLAEAVSVAMEGEFKKKIPLMVRYTQIILEISFINVTIVAYVYLLWFVRSKSKIIANARYGRTNFDKKFTMTVTYIHACLLLFTLPYFAVNAAVYNARTLDPVLERNLKYWGFILLCSNSYANAWIILYNSRRKENTKQWNKKVIWNVTLFPMPI